MRTWDRLSGRTGAGANVVLGVVLAVALAHDARQTPAGAGRWTFVLGVGAAIGALALLRTWSPLWAAAGGLGLFGIAALAAGTWGLPYPPFTSTALIGLLVLATAAARRLARRRLAFLGPAGLVVVVASEAAHAVDTFDARALFGLTGAVLWATALGVGLWLRLEDRRRIAALEGIRREERLELARELHDVVAHHVTGIIVQAQAAAFVGGEHPQALVSILSGIEEAGTEALNSMRRLVDLLRDAGDPTAGRMAAAEPVTELVERFSKHGPPVHLHISPDPPNPAWRPEVSTTVYRIVQEALTNIARHAPDARSVTVTVGHDPRQVTVEIINDAPLLAPIRSRQGSGYGLVGMRERVEALGGRLDAGPLPTPGWSVRAAVPIHVDAQS